MSQSRITIRFQHKLAEEQGGWFCIYCGKSLRPRLPSESGRPKGASEVDHLIPRSRGGNNDLVNLALCCQRCNSQKRSKTAHEFIVWLTGREARTKDDQ